MANWMCKRCGHESTTKCNLLKHLQRKTPCKETHSSISIEDHINELTHREYNERTYDCNFCSRKFNSSKNRSRHHKICKEKPVAVNPVTDETIKDLIAVLKEYFSSPDKSIKNVLTTNSNNTTINNNIQINLNSYGNEDLSHISKEFLDDCCVRLGVGMRNLVQHIHFNPDVPNNQNIKVLSNKQQLYQVFTDGQWHPKEKHNALDELIKKGYRILVKHFLATEKEEIKNVSDQIQSYLFSLLNRKSENYYQLRRELHVMVYDNTLYVLGLE